MKEAQRLYGPTAITAWDVLVTAVDKVVERPRSRSTQSQQEIWVLCRFLESAALDSPVGGVTLDRPQPDPPDFALKVGGLSIAIEITEALDPGQIREGNRRSESDEVALGPSYSGDEPERIAAGILRQSVNKKIPKMASVHGHDRMILVVYENLSLPALDPDKVVALYGGLAGPDVGQLEVYALFDKHVRRLH